MTTRLVKIVTEKLVVGQFGAAIQLDVTDELGAAADLTVYPTIIVVATSPDWTKSFEWTGTGDSLGNLSFTPSQSDSTFDRPGKWMGQVEFADSTSLLIISPIFDLEVGVRLGT
jgi:hypothetical protein